MQKMEYKWIVPFTILAFILVNCGNPYHRHVLKFCPRCHKGPSQSYAATEVFNRTSTIPAEICCSGSVQQNVHPTQYATMRKGPVFPVKIKRSPWSMEFWKYTSFITAAAQYEPYGFGTTYKDRGQDSLGKMEVAALLAHVGSKVTCDDEENGGRYIVSPAVTCGLCNYKEKNNTSNYCNDQYTDIYPCAPGVAYYGRGALPIYCFMTQSNGFSLFMISIRNNNYGEATKDLKDLKVLNVDLLKNPDYIEKNDTLAFLVAIWRWMTPIKENQPSAHDVFTGNWKPTEDDTLAKRVSGFSTTMNVLYGDLVCGKGNNETSMKKIIKYYLHYLDLIGVNRTKAGPPELLSCADQRPFNRSP